jgi:hypothetical protein
LLPVLDIATNAAIHILVHISFAHIYKYICEKAYLKKELLDQEIAIFLILINITAFSQTQRPECCYLSSNLYLLLQSDPFLTSTFSGISCHYHNFYSYSTKHPESDREGQLCAATA